MTPQDQARLDMSLNETVEETHPGDVLRRLATERSTGAVRFTGEAACTVYLHRGHLYFARDDHTDDALATALVRPGRLTPEHWAEAVTAAGDAPKVGELLVELDAIDPDLLASVMLSVVYDPMIRLFRAPPPSHTFEADTVHWVGAYRAFSVDAILAEVERRAAEVDEWSSLLPSMHVVVTANPSLPGNAPQVTLLREDWELVTALATAHTIPQLSARLGRGQFSTARVVHRLAAADLVEVKADENVPLPTRSRLDMPGRGADGASQAPTADVPDQLAEDARDGGFSETDYEAMAQWANETAVDGEAAPAEDTQPDDRDPNAVWLENLYAQYIDDPDYLAANGNGKRPNPVQVAFGARDVDEGEKVGTLKRLMGALKRL